MTYLLDTNVLVYAADRSDKGKQSKARSVLRSLGGSGTGVLSVQTLSEFANVTMLKLEPPLPPDVAYELIEQYEGAFDVLPLTASIVLEAVRGVRDHGLSYSDAQIWASARLNQVPYVLSEDFKSGATLEGVTFLNPFGAEVDVDRL